NSNNSVRVTDDFMRAVLDDSAWDTHAVRTGEPMETYQARELMRLIAEGTHVCGDPGMQFDTTINEWHTCPETDRIHASNPCSEYMFLNDSACNLASINLLKFVKEDGDYAAALPALRPGEAYAQRARIARDQGGPFSGYEKNREPFLRVMRKHRDAMRDVNARNVPPDLYNTARASWDDAVSLGEEFGYRNAQATVLAPTGTIGFMMDCDTTGVEPDIALVKYKKLVGGGLM